VVVTQSGKLSLDTSGSLTGAAGFAVQGVLSINGGSASLASLTLRSTGIIEYIYATRATSAVAVTGSVVTGGAAVVTLGASEELAPGTQIVLFTWTAGGSLDTTNSVPMRGWINIALGARSVRSRSLLQATRLSVDCTENTKSCVATALGANIANDDDDELGLIVSLTIIASLFICTVIVFTLCGLKYFRGGYGNVATARLVELDKKRSQELNRRRQRADELDAAIASSAPEFARPVAPGEAVLRDDNDSSSGPFDVDSSGLYSGSYSS